MSSLRVEVALLRYDETTRERRHAIGLSALVMRTRVNEAYVLVKGSLMAYDNGCSECHVQIEHASPELLSTGKPTRLPPCGHAVRMSPTLLCAPVAFEVPDDQIERSPAQLWEVGHDVARMLSAHRIRPFTGAENCVAAVPLTLRFRDTPHPRYTGSLRHVFDADVTRSAVPHDGEVTA